MANRDPEIKFGTLDDILEHFGHERRDPDSFHNAYQDAKLTAKIYMDMMQRPVFESVSLGFVKE